MKHIELTGSARHLERANALVISLHSPMDAGGASRLAAEHLIDSLQHERFATFDTDEHLNYHQHRPTATFEGWHFTDIDMPEIVIDLVRDDLGTDLLLLHGPEPSLRWAAFAQTIRTIVEALQIERIFVLESFPYGAPHTRPVQILLHATRRELIDEASELFGHIQIPGKLSAMLEFELGEAGHDVIGLAAAVPHYLIHNPYPAAAAALVRTLAEKADLALPVGELEAAAAHMDSQLLEHLTEQPEVAAVVSALELQYDTMRKNDAGFFTPDNGVKPLPTAEEIGAAAEAFLAEFDDGAI